MLGAFSLGLYSIHIYFKHNSKILESILLYPDLTDAIKWDGEEVWEKMVIVCKKKKKREGDRDRE